MKKLYVILLLIVTSVVLKAQNLIVDAGNDTSYCIKMRYNGFPLSNNFPIYLGGKPTAIGGKPPYVFNWTMYSKTTKQQYSLLNDSSINNKANPILYLSDYYYLDYYNFKDTLNDRFIFKVKVIDSNNIEASDSCTIILSRYGHQPVILDVFPCMEVFTKDSIQLGPCGIVGGIMPFSSFHWTPEYGLSNPYIQNPKAVLVQGRSYVNYTVTFKDSVGCSMSAGQTITDIKDGDLTTGFVSYKNPVSNSGTMNFTPELLGSTFQIVSVGGVVVYQTKVEAESLPVGSLLPVAGVYFYRLTTPVGKVINGSFVKE